MNQLPVVQLIKLNFTFEWVFIAKMKNAMLGDIKPIFLYIIIIINNNLPIGTFNSTKILLERTDGKQFFVFFLWCFLYGAEPFGSSAVLIISITISTITVI